MLHRQLIPELLGGAHRFDYDTEVLIIASRKGYRIESVPITTVYTDQVSKIHPVRDTLHFLKLMWRYRSYRESRQEVVVAIPELLTILTKRA